MDNIYAEYSTGVTELKKGPTALLNNSEEGRTIAILNHNKQLTYADGLRNNSLVSFVILPFRSKESSLAKRSSTSGVFESTA